MFYLNIYINNGGTVWKNIFQAPKVGTKKSFLSHDRDAHAASLIELDPDKFIPVDARGISKNYTKFKKAVKDAHLANYGIMNVEKYTKINFIFNIDIVIHIVFNIIKGNSKNRLSSL